MGKFISLGEYNQLYKYIWIYLSIRFITLLIFSRGFVFKQFKTELLNFPSSPFIFFQFNYIAFIIIPLIIKAIKKICKRKRYNIHNNQENGLIYNETDIVYEYCLNKSEFAFLILNLILVVISDLVDEIISKFQCSILSYWMFEMFFFEIFNSKFLKTKIYKHHIFSFIFILTSCSLIKTIVIILNFIKKTDDVTIFEYGKWLIPVSLIIYFLYHIFKAYTFCNEKYYLEKKIVPISEYMFLYGVIGFISSLICALLSTFYPCGDDNLSELSKIVCDYKDNSELYYFDSYVLYFKELSSEYFL